MKKIVKPLFFSALLHVLSLSVIAQTTPGDFGSDVKKVIQDYPNGFAHFIGEPIQENPQSTDYAATVVPVGATSAFISRYSANQKSVYSWQALILATDDFTIAKEKFRELFTRFNNMGVRTEHGVTLNLKGVYHQPAEEKTFTSSIFQFDKQDQVMGKMRLEISLQYEMMEWKVRVLIYDRDREDSERGQIVE